MRNIRKTVLNSKKMLFQGRMHPEKFQHDQIENERLSLAAIIDFNICNIHGELC